MKKLLLTMLVALFATIVVAQTKTEIKPSELPQCFKDWVTKNLPGYTIEKAYKFETKTEKGVVVSYLAKATKGKSIQWVSSGADCKDIKKISPNEADKALKPKGGQN
jgi:hypothetical protein